MCGNATKGKSQIVTDSRPLERFSISVVGSDNTSTYDSAAVTGAGGVTVSGAPPAIVGGVTGLDPV